MAKLIILSFSYILVVLMPPCTPGEKRNTIESSVPNITLGGRQRKFKKASKALNIFILVYLHNDVQSFSFATIDTYNFESPSKICCWHSEGKDQQIRIRRGKGILFRRGSKINKSATYATLHVWKTTQKQGHIHGNQLPDNIFGPQSRKY